MARSRHCATGGTGINMSEEEKRAIVIDGKMVKKILAEKYNVPEKNIIKSQYSWTVILDTEDSK